jgi:signal transduction histidine kinase
MVDKRLEAAKLEAMAEFAAGAGHEINNPIAVIAGRAKLLLDGESSAQRRRELAVIHSQAMRVYEMIADMMLFARPPQPKLVVCDAALLARQVVAEIAAKAAERNVEIAFEAKGDAATVNADSTQLAVALRAICENALQAVAAGGRIRLGVEKNSSPGTTDEPTVTIAVADDGPGVTAEVREHLFDPFYSGRRAGRGLGMGLAKAWRIVSNHRGRIDIDSQPGAGSTFTITLPAA